LDIRSDKTTGLIVAPGSLHKSGGQYVWSSVTELQPIPNDWFSFNSPVSGESGKVTGRKTGRTLERVRIPNQIPPGYVIPEGQRNTTLFQFACRERGRGASEEYIFDALMTLRDTYCERSANSKDDISDAELRSIAKSAASYPTNAEKMQR
jgi:hypothetical protein